MEFRGFTDSEVVQVVLKNYARGSNFTAFSDSVVSGGAKPGTGTVGRQLTLYSNDSTYYLVTVLRVVFRTALPK